MTFHRRCYPTPEYTLLVVKVVVNLARIALRK